MPGGRRRALSLTAGAVLLCSCFFARVRCGGEREQEEIQRLRSKVASLEDEVGWGKDETSQLESVVRERTAQIAALVSGLEALQVRNVADDETVVKASTNTAMIEKQIERLGSDLEDQVKKGELLEARASEAEKSLLQLGQKLDRVEKINAEQSRKIEELEHDVQHSEDKLSELQQQAELKAEELAIVRGMWLPYWFASRSVHCQELASAKWHLHGKPALEALTQKVAETLAHAQGLVEPHLQSTQNVRGMWLPYWFAPRSVHCQELASAKWHLHGKPALEALTQKVAETLAHAQGLVKPHLQATQNKPVPVAEGHFSSLKNSARPYVAWIAAASEPHISRASAVLEPYTRSVASAWKWLASSTSMYQRQVQRGMGRFLEDNELLNLNPLSADRLAWWTVSAMFALVVFSVLKIFSDTVRKKIQARVDEGGGRPSDGKRTRSVDE